jgi:hypothetical protein
LKIFAIGATVVGVQSGFNKPIGYKLKTPKSQLTGVNPNLVSGRKMDVVPLLPLVVVDVNVDNLIPDPELMQQVTGAPTGVASAASVVLYMKIRITPFPTVGVNELVPGPPTGTSILISASPSGIVIVPSIIFVYPAPNVSIKVLPKTCAPASVSLKYTLKLPVVVTL